MKKKTSKKPDTKLKAFRIHQPAGFYFVAAANKPQAVGTLMAHLEEDDQYEIGSCVEVNPREVEVNFEKNGGGFEKGDLSEIMPYDSPEVVLDPEYS
jgi:hypothetical protein